MASTSARPKGARPPGGGFFHGAARCSCSDWPPGISAAGFFRSLHRLPVLSGWLPRRPETDPASRTASRRSRPVRARGFRDPRRAATAGSLPSCVWPTSVPARRAAVRERFRSPFGLPPGLPKLVLSLCSYTPPCHFLPLFITIRCPRKSGSAQEFVETRILGCFLKNDEFGLCDRHALSLEQQVAEILVAAAPPSCASLNFRPHPGQISFRFPR